MSQSILQKQLALPNRIPNCLTVRPWIRRSPLRCSPSANPDKKTSEDQGAGGQSSAPEKLKDGMTKVYIGKGRFVVDDPLKYPRKDDAGGLLPGISGGWAGGEIGLKAFTEGCEEPGESEPNNGEESEKLVKSKFDGKEIVATKMGSGNDVLYVGYRPGSTEDLQARRSGKMGKFVVDDARKYPSKESFGVFDGITGGFAGGEKGVQQFVNNGDLNFVDTQISGRQWSPVVFATIIAIAGSVGAIVLTDVFDVSENLLATDILNAQLDNNTKILLEIAIGLLAVAWIGSASFATFKAMKERLATGAKGATKFVIAIGFWSLVLLVAYQITQS